MALKLVLPDLRVEDQKNREIVGVSQTCIDNSQITTVASSSAIVENQPIVRIENRVNETVEGIEYDAIDTGMEISQEQLVKEELFMAKLQSELDIAATNIKIFGMYRVVKSFDARLMCSDRSYQYLIPLKYLTPIRLKLEALSHPGYRFYFDMSEEERRMVSENTGLDHLDMTGNRTANGSVDQTSNKINENTSNVGSTDDDFPNLTDEMKDRIVVSSY